jgi:hypothetical protein
MASNLRLPTAEKNERYLVAQERDICALVQAHTDLDEEMTAALWIYQDSREVWLVEVIPSMFENDRAELPIQFNPTLDFRWPLKLIIANPSDLHAAIRRDSDLAAAIIAGQVLHEVNGAGQDLQAFATQTLSGATHDLPT